MSRGGSDVMGRVRRAADRIRAEGGPAPEWAATVEAGLDVLAEEVTVEADLPYREIPGFTAAAAGEGEGRLLLGTLEGRGLAVLRGRNHRCPGHSLGRATFPVRVLRELGAEALLTAERALGTDPRWAPGELVLISDHINFTGDNPLVGPNVEEQGPRFPDMSGAYDPELRRRARGAALELGLRVREGVYLGVTGPDLATPAECRMMRTLGADLVGTSTVPEVIVARHVGLRVLGTAVIGGARAPDGLEAEEAGQAAAAGGDAARRLSRVARRVVAGDGSGEVRVPAGSAGAA